MCRAGSVPVLDTILPSAFFAVKARVDKLGPKKVLVPIYLLLFLGSVAAFVVLYHTFVQEVEVTQHTETIVADQVLEGYECRSISGVMPPRTLTLSCANNITGTPQNCLANRYNANSTSSATTFPNGFGGHFYDPQQKTIYEVDVYIRDPVYEPSYSSCIDNFFDAHCGDVQTGSVANDLMLQWTFAYPIGRVPPVIGSEGTIFVPTDGIYMHAVDPSDGSIRWTMLTNFARESPTLSSDGTTLYIVVNGELVAVTVATGVQKWKYTVAGFDLASLTNGRDSTLYVICTDKQLHALNAHDGSLKWTYPIGERYAFHPVVSSEGSFIYVAHARALHVVHAASGTAQWVYATETADGDIRFSPTLAKDGTLVFVCVQSAVHALNSSNGSIKWKRKTGSVVSPVAASDDGTLYIPSLDKLISAKVKTGAVNWKYAVSIQAAYPVTVTASAIYVGDANKNDLHAVNPSDGSRKWIFSTIDVSPPAINSYGNVVVGGNRQLHVLNGWDGSLKWGFATNGNTSVKYPPLVGKDDTIFITSSDSKMYAVRNVLNEVSGSARMAMHATGGVVSTPVMTSDGTTLYFGSSDGMLHAANLANRRLSNPRWGGFRKWAYNTHGVISDAPAIGSDGTIYVVSSSTMHAVHPDGSMKWVYTTDDGRLAALASPAIGGDGTIFVGAAAGLSVSDTVYTLHAVNPDGSKKWVYEADGVVSLPAFGTDGTIFIGCGESQNLHAVHPNGTMKWIYTAGGRMSAPAVGSDGTVYVSSTVTEDLLHAVRSSDGSMKWTKMLFELGPPTVGPDGIVYVGSYYYLHAIDPRNPQTVKWSIAGFASGSAPPVVGSDGNIYVSLDNGDVAAATPNGDVVHQYPPTYNFLSSPAVGGDGTVFVGSHDHNLYIMFSPLVLLHGGECFLSSLSGGKITFQTPFFLSQNHETPQLSKCNEEYRRVYCSADSPQALSFRAQYCEAFKNLPPYSCTREYTREHRRSMLESVSLAFSFAQLVYTVVLFLIVRVLYLTFKRSLHLSTPRYGARHEIPAPATPSREKNYALVSSDLPFAVEESSVSSC
eukprot:m.245252 g.245252  ORF g.245252 m.245252 type:complete len:1056 (-) comp15362_c0_seq1:322-3489(-)